MILVKNKEEKMTVQGIAKVVAVMKETQTVDKMTVQDLIKEEEEEDVVVVVVNSNFKNLNLNFKETMETEKTTQEVKKISKWSKPTK
jgi:hypothetical protein